MSDISAYQQGLKACESGQSLADNPFGHGRINYRRDQWRLGWLDSHLKPKRITAMKKFGLILAAALALTSSADAQITLTIPAPLYNSATSATCAGVPGLNTPVASGTTVFNCIVSPASWTGTVTSNLVAPYALGPIVGNTFTIIVNVAVPTVPTVVPGSVTVN